MTTDEVESADDAAYAASLAWVLGPETFLAHVDKRNESILAKMQEAYNALAVGDGQPETEVDADGNSSASSGAGRSSGDVGSDSSADTGRA